MKETVSTILYVNIDCGTKIGYSPYLIVDSFNPTHIKEIRGFFMAASLESAVKKVVRDYSFLFEGDKIIHLLTGDGQLIDISISISMRELKRLSTHDAKHYDSDRYPPRIYD